MTDKDGLNLRAILQDEAEILLRGDYTQLGRILVLKEAFANSAEQIRISPGELQDVAAALSRNAALLQAASAGIDDARRTLNALVNKGKTEFYDRDGQRLRMCDHAGKLTKKA